MKCNIKAKELSLYIDGRYSGKAKELLEEHLVSCASCKEQLENLKLLQASLKALPAVKESQGFDFEFNRLLDERLNKKAPVFEIPGRIKETAANIRDSFISPVPAFVRVAASFILVIAAIWSIRANTLYKIPFVEFSAGEVELYRASQGQWQRPALNTKLKQGDKIRLGQGAILNIASRDKYKMRVKDSSFIVISKLDSRWRSIDTDINVAYGNLLVNTTKEFKGSGMKIYTPACDAEIVGTAFMVKALENNTWLGVLEGKVKVDSKIHPLKTEEKEIAYVSSGQKVSTERYCYPTEPELFSEKEWRMMQELYQLTEDRKIMLLIGTGPDRIEELLKVAPIYIPDVKRRAMPLDIRNVLELMKDARERGDFGLVGKYTGELENLISEYPNLEYNVELLMFAASHYHYIHRYEDAIRVFKKVMEEHPDSSFASLAQCGIATIYEQDLKDVVRAEKTYKELLTAYPNSVDAIRAKETLMALH